MGRVAESACSGDIRVGGAVWSSVGNILSGYIVGFIGIKCRLFFGLLPLRWLLSLDNNGREILWLSMMSYLVIFSFVILRASKFSNAYANVFYKESRGGVILERNIRKLFEISFEFCSSSDRNEENSKIRWWDLKKLLSNNLTNLRYSAQSVNKM